MAEESSPEPEAAEEATESPAGQAPESTSEPAPAAKAAQGGTSEPKSPAKPAEKPAAKPAAKPARVLPSQEEIAAWIEGDDLPSLANLFNILPLVKFDALVMQIRKAELLPQHWQVISSRQAPPDEVFESLPEVGRLRLRYREQELSRRRLAALKVAWRELRGKRPSLWTVPDLFAAMRRILDKKLQVDHHELLSATRDVWRELELPAGTEQLQILWACLSFIRDKTKK